MIRREPLTDLELLGIFILPLGSFVVAGILAWRFIRRKA